MQKLNALMQSICINKKIFLIFNFIIIYICTQNNRLVKKIRYLSVRFKEKIKEWEIPLFRSAIIHVAGKEHVLFHNHLEDGYLYKYPLIQYKTIQQKPAIICLDKGIEEIYHFFNKKSWDLMLNDKLYKSEIDDLKLNNHVLQVWDSFFQYKIVKWLPLNEKNYATYNSIHDESERKNFLENILCGNILSFAKGVDWRVEKEIKCRIKKITNIRWIGYKQTKLLSMDIHFDSNVSIPYYIGLGKGASKGYGIVKKDRCDSEVEEKEKEKEWK